MLAVAAETVQVKAQGDYVDALWCGNPEIAAQLPFLARADGDNACAFSGQVALNFQKDPRFARAEVRMKHMPVKGVQHHRNTFVNGGQAAHRARFGGVRVHDVRTKLADDAAQFAVRQVILLWAQFALHVLHKTRLYAQAVGNELAGGFGVVFHARYQQGLVLRRQVAR